MKFYLIPIESGNNSSVITSYSKKTTCGGWKQDIKHHSCAICFCFIPPIVFYKKIVLPLSPLQNPNMLLVYHTASGYMDRYRWHKFISHLSTVCDTPPFKNKISFFIRQKITSMAVPCVSCRTSIKKPFFWNQKSLVTTILDKIVSM